MTSVTFSTYAGRYVAVGYDNNNYPLFAVSSDGSTWSTPALMNGSTSIAEMQAVSVSESGTFIAVGQDNNGIPLVAGSPGGYSDPTNWSTPVSISTTPPATVNIGVGSSSWTYNSSGIEISPVNAVAGLPSPASGARSFVNDSTVPAAGNFGQIVAGGAGNTVPVWSDGTNWYIG
jgi:hypothetical protein